MNAFGNELRARLETDLRLSEATATLAKTAGLDHPAFEDLIVGESIDEYAAVVFLDIRGFTRLAMALDVATTARIVHAVVGAAAARLREYGAHINDFTGDGIMAVFSERAAEGDRDVVHSQAIYGVSHLMAEMSTALRPELLLAGVKDEVSVAIGLYSGDVRWQRVGLDECSRVMILGEVAPLAAKYVTEKDVAKAWQIAAGGDVAKSVPLRLREKCAPFVRQYDNVRMPRERWLLDSGGIFAEVPDLARAAGLMAEARKASMASMAGVVSASPRRRGDGGRRDHGVG